jgi:hypothetical protein
MGDPPQGPGCVVCVWFVWVWHGRSGGGVCASHIIQTPPPTLTASLPSFFFLGASWSGLHERPVSPVRKRGLARP